VTEFEYVYSLNAGFFSTLFEYKRNFLSRRNQHSRYIVFPIIQNTMGWLVL